MLPVSGDIRKSTAPKFHELLLCLIHLHVGYFRASLWIPSFRPLDKMWLNMTPFPQPAAPLHYTTAQSVLIIFPALLKGFIVLLGSFRGTVLVLSKMDGTQVGQVSTDCPVLILKWHWSFLFVFLRKRMLDCSVVLYLKKTTRIAWEWFNKKHFKYKVYEKHHHLKTTER